MWIVITAKAVGPIRLIVGRARISVNGLKQGKLREIGYFGNFLLKSWEEIYT